MSVDGLGVDRRSLGDFDGIERSGGRGNAEAAK